MSSVRVDALFIGQVARLDGDSRDSAIVKAPVAGPVPLGAEGLAGDAQADRRVHGGVEKALHLYPAEHYARLAAAFPDAAHLHAGGLGENLSTQGLDETTVCIGDRYALGGALIEVSQPRSPCWKIDHRTGVEGVAAFIARHGLTGWYFRVLAPGPVAAGDALTLVARPEGAVLLADYWHHLQAARPDPDTVDALARAPGLAADKRQKLQERAAWLRANPLPTGNP